MCLVTASVTFTGKQYKEMHMDRSKGGGIGLLMKTYVFDGGTTASTSTHVTYFDK
jgi:hypothetical protein